MYEKIFEEIIVENFPYMGKEIVKSKRCRVPYRINPRRNMLRHMVIKLAKTEHKERILNAPREEQQVTYNRNPIHLQLIFQQKLYRQEVNGRIYLKY